MSCLGSLLGDEETVPDVPLTRCLMALLAGGAAARGRFQPRGWSGNHWPLANQRRLCSLFPAVPVLHQSVRAAGQLEKVPVALRRRNREDTFTGLSGQWTWTSHRLRKQSQDGEGDADAVGQGEGRVQGQDEDGGGQGGVKAEILGLKGVQAQVESAVELGEVGHGPELVGQELENVAVGALVQDHLWRSDKT